MSQLSSDLRSDQLAPHSVDAEIGVLGSCISNPEQAIPAASALIGVDDFFIVRHAWIWEAIMAAQSEIGAVDYLTVLSILEQRDQLSELGGAAYLLHIVNEIVHSLNVEAYARIVKAMSFRRSLISFASQVTRLAHSDETNVLHVYRSVEESFHKLAPGTLAAARSAKQLGSELYDRLAKSTGKIEPESCGLLMLDEILGLAYGNGQFTVIGGYMNSGKSHLAAQMAAHASKTKPVLYVTLEADAEQIFTGMVAAESGVPQTLIETEDLNEAQRAKVITAIGELSERMLEIEPLWSLEAIRARVMEMMVKYDFQPVMLFIDDFDSLAKKSRGGSVYEQHGSLAIDLLEMVHLCTGGVVATKQLLVPTDLRSTTNFDAIYDRLRPTILSTEGGRTIAQKASTVITFLSGDWVRQKINRGFTHKDLPAESVQFYGLRYRGRKASGVLSAYLHWDADTPRFEDYAIAPVISELPPANNNGHHDDEELDAALGIKRVGVDY